MLGWSTVVTAGHCIYDRDREVYAFNVTITPGYNVEDINSKPFGQCKTLGHIVPYEYVQTGHTGYDYGIYELDCKVGEFTGSPGIKTTPGDGVGIWSALVGFPFDKTHGTMWTGGGSVTSSSPTRFYYDNDTGGWQSGSPLWVTDPNCNPCVIATHANSFPEPTMNQGTRINQDAFELFVAERNIVPTFVYLPIVFRE